MTKPFARKVMSKATKAKKGSAKAKNPLFVARKKTFAIGQDMMYKRDLTHATKFPRYVRLQRKMKTLKKRLKSPPQIHQFSNYADQQTKINLAIFLKKNAPETSKMKKIRVQSALASNNIDINNREDRLKQVKLLKTPYTPIKYGVSEVTKLVQQHKAKLVIIAANVDPIINVLHLPSLCAHHNVAYCIVADKGWLGQFVHQKKVSSIAITEPKADTKELLNNLVKTCMVNYNNVYETTRTTWGTSELSVRAQKVKDKKESIRKAEEEKARKVVIES
ncbi:MAG: 60S ribosomal protein L7A [Paramarteilia canceri]